MFAATPTVAFASHPLGARCGGLFENQARKSSKVPSTRWRRATGETYSFEPIKCAEKGPAGEGGRPSNSV